MGFPIAAHYQDKGLIQKLLHSPLGHQEGVFRHHSHDIHLGEHAGEQDSLRIGQECLDREGAGVFGQGTVHRRNLALVGIIPAVAQSYPDFGWLVTGGVPGDAVFQVFCQKVQVFRFTDAELHIKRIHRTDSHQSGAAGRRISSHRHIVHCHLAVHGSVHHRIVQIFLGLSHRCLLRGHLCLILSHLGTLAGQGLLRNGPFLPQLLIPVQVLLGIAQGSHRLVQFGLSLCQCRLILTGVQAVERISRTHHVTAAEIFFHDAAGHPGMDLHFFRALELSGEAVGHRRILPHELHGLDGGLASRRRLLIAAARQEKAGGQHE